MARSRPSSASNARPCSDESFVSIPTSLRPIALRSMPWMRGDGWLRCDRGDALELWCVDVEDGARIGAVGLSGVLVEIEREIDARRTRVGSHRVEPCGERRRKRRDQVGELTERRSARIECQLSGSVDAIESYRRRPPSRCRAGRSSIDQARSFLDRSRAWPPAAAVPGPPKWRGRYPARAVLRPAIRLAARPANAPTLWRHRDRAAPLSIPLQPASRCWPAAATPRYVPRRRHHRSRLSSRRWQSRSRPW